MHLDDGTYREILRHEEASRASKQLRELIRREVRAMIREGELPPMHYRGVVATVPSGGFCTLNLEGNTTATVRARVPSGLTLSVNQQVDLVAWNFNANSLCVMWPR